MKKLVRACLLLASLGISFLMIVGCASVPKPEETGDKLPTWFTNPRPNSSKHLYATGSGNTPDEARSVALKELAGFFNRTVASQTKLHKRASKNEVEVNYEQKISSDIQKLELDNYETTRVAEVGSTYYVEVSLNSKNYATNIQRRFGETYRILSEAFKRTNSPLRDYYRMKAARPKLRQAWTYLHVLRVVEQNFNVNMPINFEAVYSKLRSFRKLENEVQREARVVFSVSNPARPVAKQLPGLFQENGINAVLEPERSVERDQAAEIKITSNENLGLDSGSRVVDFEVVIEVYSRGGELLSRQSFEQTGKSKLSFTKARDRARNQLREDLESLEVETLLGLKGD